MSDVISTNLLLTLPEVGAHDNDWGAYLNEDLDTIDEKFGDTTAISTTGGTTTLTSAQEIVSHIDVTGVLGSNATIVFSGRGGLWSVRNGTTGAFSVTAKVSGQTGVAIPAGSEGTIRCNGTDVFWTDRPTPTFSNNVLCPSKNLIVRRASAATVVVSADGVVLSNSVGRQRFFASLSETLDLSTSGVNGRDAGSETSSTWEHAWAIGKEDGTLDGVISTSASAPSLPAGYTWYGYLGAFYNDASSNIVSFYQTGHRVVGAANANVLTAGSATSATVVSLAAFVPPNAKTARIYALLSAGAVQITSDATGTTPTYATELIGSGVGYYQGDVVLTTAQQLKYWVVTGPVTIVCNGWSY